MTNKEVILEAIDNYDVYSAPGRAILKTLVAASDENNIAHLSMKSLEELSKVSKQGIYNCMRYLERDNLIERSKITGHRLSIFKLNSIKLEDIVQYYKNLQQTKSILKKI
jgi:CTP-dependent riboflavin kinase